MRGLLPGRDAAVDLGFVLVLGMVCTFGLRDSYTGWGFLAAGAAGLVLGGLLAHVGNALRLPTAVITLLAVAGFFLLGGLVARQDHGLLAALPLPATVKTLAEQLVFGWKDLLTTLAPVDGGPLLTLPYFMALVTAAASVVLAARTRSALWPVLVPVLHLATVILLGIRFPDRVLLVGAVFAVLAIGWIAVRARRGQPEVRGRRSWRARAAAVGLVAGSALLATLAGPLLTGAESRERVVLRAYVAPPFDVGQYPTPLAGFRKYTEGYRAAGDQQRLHDVELFTVEGLPEGSRIRFAALDRYDGFVWGASPQAPDTHGADGTFQRVGTHIRDEGPGERHTARVTIGEGYRSVWLPTAGSLEELRFDGPDGDTLSEVFRYNLATDTGVVPRGIEQGDTYSFTAFVPAEEHQVAPDMTVSQAGLAEDASGIDFVPVATRWGGAEDTSLQLVLSIARYLHDTGAYTDGGKGEENHTAGHSVGRLSRFSAKEQQVAGNDEQYAAMMAVLANQLGVPARVVMGAVVPGDGVVEGRHVRAWLEIRDSSGAWRELPTDTFMSRERPPEDQPPSPQDLVSGEVIPPPAPIRPPATAGDPLATDDNRRDRHQDDDQGGFSLPGWLVAVLTYVGLPLLAIALVLGAIIGAKAVRRRRRRRIGAPDRRLHAAWQELVDAARDLGALVTSHRTRREQAEQVGAEPLRVLARQADSHVFGRAEPDDGTVAGFWSEVERARREMLGARTRWQRFRAAVSLASFRRLPRPEGPR